MGGCCSTRKSVDLPTVPPPTGSSYSQDYPTSQKNREGQSRTNVGSTNMALEMD
ncbi:unnamed protein product [Ceratitis capitata]|uniref:(Mediterranean fruit fly) hypothetical protein n=1 Tax=Ceratitis capitata TaxID=7213 RepID=A0A811U9Q0_CERCA|nr:unnamed protein product [Ceratitis capitata]